MKKFLFLSSVLSSFVLIQPAVAQQTSTETSQATTQQKTSQKTEIELFDQPIELQIGGYMSWYAAYANQKKNSLIMESFDADTFTPFYNNIGKYNNFDIMGDAEIYFSGSTTLENGVKIGAMVQLEAGTDSDTSNHTIDETYMTIDSGIGRIILGNVKNVSYQMAVTSPTISTLGLQETDFRRLVMVPADFAYNKATYSLLDDISTKLSYITPTVSGFTFGVSLMPGNKKKGKDANDLLTPYRGDIKLFKYGVDATALYQHDFGKFDIETSASYTMYKPNLRANGFMDEEKEIRSYGAGINIGFGNWTVGGSFLYTNMSHETNVFLLPFADVAKGASWDVGVEYSAGPFAASANIFQSRADNINIDGKKDIFTMYLLSGKYKILAGIDTFIDIAYVDYKSGTNNPQLDNKGPAVAIGMNLNF